MGSNWFGMLQCRRCLKRFKADVDGEVPVHECIGGLYRSVSDVGVYHIPVEVDDDEGPA